MNAPKILEPVRHGQFKYIAASQLVSSFGDWLSFVAVLSVVAYKWHLGAGGLAVVAMAQALPWLVFGSLSGVVADRYPRKPILVGTSLVRAICVAAFVLAPNLIALSALLAVKSALSALYTITEATAVKDTVPIDQLIAANSLTSFVNQSSKIIGPSLGGLLFVLVGADAAFLVDAVTFVAAAGFLARLELPAQKDESGAEGGGRPSFGELSAGFRVVARIEVLRLAMLSLSLTVFLAFVFDTLTPLAVSGLGLSSQFLGISIGAVGAGSAVGALAIGQWGQDVAPLRLMSASQLAAGSLVAVAGILMLLGPPTPVAGTGLVTIMLGIGFAASGIFIGYPTILQAATPEGKLGRVMAVAQVLPTALQLLAPLVGAGLATLVGVGPVFAGAGGALALLGMLFLTTRGASWRPGQVEVEEHGPSAAHVSFGANRVEPEVAADEMDEAREVPPLEGADDSASATDVNTPFEVWHNKERNRK